MLNPLKSLFLLDSDIIYLNHGSSGACPRPVFEAYQDWQLKLERQPTLFLSRKIVDYNRQARQTLGDYLHAKPDDLVFVTNATYGVNVVAHSLLNHHATSLKPGDEILSTNHEYGACNNTWEFICQKAGATYIRQPISLPVFSADEIVDQFWQAVTPRTKVIFLSHITSPTAFRLPVEAICARARQAGILTLVDGAHAPGQIPLDLEGLGADFYVGNCHKWMMSPKGAGFLYARNEVQEWIEPLVVSWGFKSNQGKDSGSHFVDYVQWIGTRDPAAELSVPAAIQFMQEYHWDEVREQCHKLLYQAIQRMCKLTNLPAPYPLESEFYCQMGIAPLPSEVDLAALKTRLYDDFRVEIPLIHWQGQKFARISVQGYNTQDDIDILVEALGKLIPIVTSSSDKAHQ